MLTKVNYLRLNYMFITFDSTNNNSKMKTITFKEKTFIKGTYYELMEMAKAIEEKGAEVYYSEDKKSNHLWWSYTLNCWYFEEDLSRLCDHELTKSQLYEAYGIKTNKPEYDLDFYDALKVVMEGGCVKGNNFVDGIYLKLNSRGQLVTVDAGRLYMEETNVFISGMKSQKFRELTVMSMKELSR